MLHITPEMLVQGYELLRTTKPFKGWKLPHADEITFAVTRHRDRCADTSFNNGQWTMRVSQVKHCQLITLLMSIGHEMVHMRQMKLNGRERDHGVGFQRLANQVCKAHGWDRGIF